jgi:hypothetical protein
MNALGVSCAIHPIFASDWFENWWHKLHRSSFINVNITTLIFKECIFKVRCFCAFWLRCKVPSSVNSSNWRRNPISHTYHINVLNVKVMNNLHIITMKVLIDQNKIIRSTSMAICRRKLRYQLVKQIRNDYVQKLWW